MSTGLIPIDVAIAANAETDATSAAGQAMTLNYNPAFLAGGGTLSYAPSGNSPSAGGSATASAPQGQTDPATVTPPGASGTTPGTTTTAPISSSTMLFLLLIGGAALLLTGGKK